MRESDTMANIQTAPAVSLKDVYRVKADDYTETEHTGDTLETTLKSYTIPANYLGATGSIVVCAGGRAQVVGGNKTIRLKFGSTVIHAITLEPATEWRVLAYGWNKGVVNQQHWNFMGWDGLALEVNDPSDDSAIDTSADSVISITGQLAGAAELISCCDFKVLLKAS